MNILFCQFQILITYYTHRRLYLDESSSDYLYLFSRKKYFWKKVHSFSPTITGVKANPSSWNLAHRSIFYIFEPCSLPEKIGLLWPKVLEIKNFSKYIWIAFSQRTFYLSTSIFKLLLHTSITIFGWKFQVVLLICFGKKNIFVNECIFFLRR